MKTHSKSRNHSSGNHETLTSKSFESTQRRKHPVFHPSKDFAESNDMTEKHKKPSFPKKFVNFLQNASLSKTGDMSATIGLKNIKYPETQADIQHSIQSESERGLDTSKEEYSPRFETRSKSVQRKAKGRSFLTENTRPDQRADTVNITLGGFLTKDSDLSTNKFLFQTYDNNSSFMSKKGINTTKLANKTLLKYAEQVKQQGSGSKKGSTRASSTMKPDQGVNRSFYEMDPSLKQRTSPSQRRPSLNERAHKAQDSIPVRNATPARQRKSGESKRARSFIAVDGHELKEKEMLELNAGLVTYHDLLIERGQTDVKILESLKDNFSSVVKEVAKYQNIVQQYDGMKQQFNVEREKTKKEKELLEFQLNVLKKENERLKSLNMKYIKHDEAHLDESIEKAKNKSAVSKEIKEAIAQEQKLTEMLMQREKVISFLRTKENQYISLLDAINNQGINVKKIYKEHMNKFNNSCESEDTRVRTLPDEFEESKTKKSYTRPAIPHRLPKTKKFSTTEGDEVLDLNLGKQGYGKNLKKQVVQDKGALVVVEQKGIEQQSIHSSMLSHSNTTQYDERESITTPELKPRMEVVEELSAELKERLKLDLSSMQNKDIKQYHDEFMEKWNEFTSSWKREMAKDKTYQHLNPEQEQ